MQPKIEESVSRNPIFQKVLSKVTLRRAVQAFIALLMLYAAWEFNNFVEYIRADSTGPVPDRAPMVEGFLPIAAILAFKAWIATGFIDNIHPAGLMIFVATLITAWVFRRALCSWICPIGTLSEYLAILGRKLIGKNLNVPKWLDTILLGLKFVLFFYIAKAFIFLPAQQAIAFMKIPYYAISDIKMFEFFFKIGTIGLMVILVLVILSIFIKSFWCRYLCPYGALLGAVSFFSPVILTKNAETCIDCGRCNQVCPNKVDVQGKKRFVITSECTGCTSCVSACPKDNTLEFKLLGKFRMSAFVFSIGFLAVFFGIILLAKATGHWETVLMIQDYKLIYQMMSGGGM